MDEAFAKLKATDTKLAAAAARARLAAGGPWAGGGHRALKALSTLTHDAQASLGDVKVSPVQVRRGWGGL